MKKYDIVFSIPVHEKYEVVIDLVLNMFHYNQNCAIVLHYSNGFRDAKSDFISFDTFERKIVEIGNVYINPETVRTGVFDIIQAHISNFRYVESLIDFDFFAITASNEVFIRGGLYSHIRGYDCGVTFIDVDTVKTWMISDLAKQDMVLKGYLASRGWSKIMGSHVEGSFYKKDIMSEIIDHIEQFFNYKEKGVIYARDEIFFSTILWNISQDRKVRILENGLYCWTPWDKFYENWDVFIRDIKRLRSKENKIFSVKRVPREINHYVRRFIRKDAGYLKEEQELLGTDKIRSINMLQISLCELRARFLAFHREIRNDLLSSAFVIRYKPFLKKLLFKG